MENQASDGVASPGFGRARSPMSGRAAPERVRFDVQPGVAPSPKPPVRIFVGTQPAQFRAERAFIWSIAQVRDPSRVYEIYVMRELVDFDRSRWTTGFTNYRFAIPELAGRAGKAIWNDVDQIYLADPAGLFDLDMKGHGFLAIAPEGKVDTAVMLIDCARMAEIWPLEDAQRGRKKALISKAMAVPGLHGLLDVEWHARDEKDFDRVRTKLLHYTTLHTQPWWPAPERFIYHEHRLAHLWHDLERSADAAGYQQFTAARPSSAFVAMREQAPWSAFLHEVTPFVDELTKATAATSVHRQAAYDPLPSARFDGVVSASGLESVPEDDVPWLLDGLFGMADRFLVVGVDCQRLAASRPADVSESCLYSDPARWPSYMTAASRRRPSVHWELLLYDTDDTGRTKIARHWGGPFLGAPQPRVWVIHDDEAGSRAMGLALAAELEWPCEIKSAGDVAGTVPAAPDLVIAAGEGVRGLAQEIRREASSRTRVVLLSGEASPRVEDLDLVVSSVAAGSFPDPRLMETIVPLSRLDAGDLARAAADEGLRVDALARPRLGVAIAGPSLATMTISFVDELLDEIVGSVAGEGGSLFVVASPELADDVVASIRTRLGEHGLVVCGSSVRRERGYLAWLASCEGFLVLGDDEQSLADVCATGRPVTIYPVETVEKGVTATVRRAVHALAVAPRKNDRGTTRPQQGIELFASSLISRGYVKPPRDHARMYAALVASGAAQMFGEPRAGEVARPLREVARVADRVRALVGVTVKKEM